MTNERSCGRGVFGPLGLVIAVKDAEADAGVAAKFQGSVDDDRLQNGRR